MNPTSFSEKDARRIASVTRRHQFDKLDHSQRPIKNAFPLSTTFQAIIDEVEADALEPVIFNKYAWQEVQLIQSGYLMYSQTNIGNPRVGTLTDNFAVSPNRGNHFGVGDYVTLMQQWYDASGTLKPYCIVVSPVNRTVPVKCNVAEGEAGSCSGTCSFTYDVYDINDNMLANNETPIKTRLPNVKYNTPSNGADGLGIYGTYGAFSLVEVFTETPQTDTKEFVTGVTCNGENGTISVTKENITYLKCE